MNLEGVASKQASTESLVSITDDEGPVPYDHPTLLKVPNHRKWDDRTHNLYKGHPSVKLVERAVSMPLSSSASSEPKGGRRAYIPEKDPYSSKGQSMKYLGTPISTLWEPSEQKVWRLTRGTLACKNPVPLVGGYHNKKVLDNLNKVSVSISPAHRRAGRTVPRQDSTGLPVDADALPEEEQAAVCKGRRVAKKHIDGYEMSRDKWNKTGEFGTYGFGPCCSPPRKHKEYPVAGSHDASMNDPHNKKPPPDRYQHHAHYSHNDYQRKGMITLATGSLHRAS